GVDASCLFLVHPPMLFPDSRSGLVRLSDCVKVSLESCATTTTEILELYAKYEFSFRRAREIALRTKDREFTDEEIEQISRGVPSEVAAEGVGLQGLLHSRSLSSVLV